MLLKIGKTIPEHSPNVSGKELDAQQSTRIVASHQGLGRCLRHNDHVKISKVLIRLASQIVRIDGYLNHRVQRLGAQKRCLCAIFAHARLWRQELGAPIVFRERTMVEESDRLDAGQNYVLCDFGAQTAETAQQDASGPKSVNGKGLFLYFALNLIVV